MVASIPQRVEGALQRISQRRWSATIVFLYLLVVTWVLLRHVLWRDEAQMWLVGRASGSLGDLLANMQYENRPALWFLLLWPIARISSNPDAIKILTWFAAAGAAYIVSRYLPLRRIEQIAVLGGFLFLVGYSTSSTGYTVGVLATLLWFVMYSRDSLVGQFACAALMAATHALFLLLAAPLWVLSFLLCLGKWSSDRGLVARRWLPAALGSAAVFLWSAWLIVPPADYGFDHASATSLSQGPALMAKYAAAAVIGPGVDLPRALANLPSVIWALPVAVVAVVGLVRGRWVALAPVFGLILTLANGVFGYGPFWWHSGVSLIAVMLIVLMTRQSNARSPFRGLMLTQSAAWWVILGIQMIAVISVPGMQLWGPAPLSGGREAAAAIERACPNGCTVITGDDALGPPVSAYLGGTPLFSLETQMNSTFTVWDDRQRHGHPISWETVRAALKAKGPNAVAVMSAMGIPPEGFEIVAWPAQAVLPEEAYFVVRLPRETSTG